MRSIRIDYSDAETHSRCGHGLSEDGAADEDTEGRGVVGSLPPRTSQWGGTTIENAASTDLAATGDRWGRRFEQTTIRRRRGDSGGAVPDEG